jgi:RNA polymerase primary sigma factor
MISAVKERKQQKRQPRRLRIKITQKGRPDQNPKLWAARLQNLPIRFIFSDEFTAADADDVILAEPPPAIDPPRKKAPSRQASGLSTQLAHLCALPLLSSEEETYYFRKMNYLKYKADRLRTQINPEHPSVRMLQQIERWLGQASRIRNVLTERNMRLVVSIVKRYTRYGADLSECVSDATESLMKAIDCFDYRRGFKLSTYATWAIRRNFARAWGIENARRASFATGQDEMIADAQSDGTSQFQQERNQTIRKDVLKKLLKQLSTREQRILTLRFGLGTEERGPLTLKATGQRIGVTKERIRQIEKRALDRLLGFAMDMKVEIPDT